VLQNRSSHRSSTRGIVERSRSHKAPARDRNGAALLAWLRPLRRISARAPVRRDLEA
jgi:hypothetical protein